MSQGLCDFEKQTPLTYAILTEFWDNRIFSNVFYLFRFFVLISNTLKNTKSKIGIKISHNPKHWKWLPKDIKRLKVYILISKKCVKIHKLYE